MIKAIIFDCFGVLTTDHWKEFAAALPPEQFEAARAWLYQMDSGQISRAEFITNIEKLTGHTPRTVEELLSGERLKNDGLLAYIEHLAANYNIGLLSNISSNWIRDSFLSPAEQKLFDSMVFSYEVGMAKPDPGIFELAAERLGAKTSECVMVDDSEGHCSAAAEAGMSSIIYENLAQLKRELKRLLADSKS